MFYIQILNFQFNKKIPTNIYQDLHRPIVINGLFPKTKGCPPEQPLEMSLKIDTTSHPDESWCTPPLEEEKRSYSPSYLNDKTNFPEAQFPLLPGGVYPSADGWGGKRLSLI
ncbi:hypothetical protein [Draconibacterium sediminis]|uniref:Uncharacterized protein n=1 Tax=Draconibacterium sediminis TaxID=1544798 RepID=A0A0D8JD46_9BACT|nr:hypothetical protein [Draconibacterium sediminis]KJF44639.1 hypothetical protein LH29_04030 [Draconibacterium sediminis]